MKVVILNGSPKGEYSVTYQYARYWEILSSNNTFQTFHIGSKINLIDRDKNELLKIFDAIESADFVLWAYPVYTSLVPYQVMRFIELVIENSKSDIFKGKFTTQIVTSRHFYDHTAYNYLKKICEEWEMNIIQGHLADMMDLTKKEGQKRLNDFISEIDWMTSYKKKEDSLEKSVKSDKRISIITDATTADVNLNKMIELYAKNVDGVVDILNLNDLDLKSGCMGCLYCTIEGHCVIKDDFQENFSKFFKDSDVIIYAAKIKNHSFGSLWKKFDDRQFSNGHRISLMGRSVGYLISGDLSNEDNLKQVIESRVEVGHVFLLDIITDEIAWDKVTLKINKMAEKTKWALENKPERPVNFLGVGGMRVFRDLIYAMRGMMQEDHKFYKKHNLYDFPHKEKATILQGYLIGAMMKSKKVRSKILPKLKEMMLKPFEKVINGVK